MKDLCLTDESFIELKSLVLHENLRQLEKWGVQDHEPFEWLGFATEELGETAQAIGEFCYRGGLAEDVVKEAIQTATLMLKIAEMYQHLLVIKI
uniref:NTP pyrophosphohydrolase MazG putative catalytic core domain-containing protein n=1 Tax=viral metagenome TaxID=1070528 RepID=A0A6M3LSQ5_9ZZZZ